MLLLYLFIYTYIILLLFIIYIGALRYSIVVSRTNALCTSRRHRYNVYTRRRTRRMAAPGRTEKTVCVLGTGSTTRRPVISQV